MLDIKRMSESFDVERAAMLREALGPARFDLVLRSMEQEMATISLRIRDDIARGDREDLAVAAHALKGIAANLGAALLRDRASALESAARNGGVIDGTSELDAAIAVTAEAIARQRAA